VTRQAASVCADTRAPVHRRGKCRASLQVTADECFEATTDLARWWRSKPPRRPAAGWCNFARSRPSSSRQTFFRLNCAGCAERPRLRHPTI
jgi:hypothetical protein